MNFKAMMLRGKAAIMNAVIAALAVMIFWPSLAQAAWIIQGVDTPKSFSNLRSRSIAIDKATGHPHLAYGEDHLYHAYYDGTQWVYETVDDSPGVGSYAAIAIDAHGKIHISYLDATNGDLKYATDVLGVWEAITVDSGNVGQNTSIAIDSNNKAHISYTELSNGYTKEDLKYATNASGTWVAMTVDSEGDAEWGTSIALDGNNKSHIGYFDEWLGTVRYATNASGSWVTATVDVGGGGYGNISIAIDSGNKEHLSYTDDYLYNLKYATNASGTWDITTLDSAGYVGHHSSIAIDGNNKEHIAYYDGSNGDLKYATNATGIWDITTVDSTGDVGWYTSIAIDNNNKEHISYYDYTNKYLKYGTNASGTWITTAVDSAGTVGQWTSIALDSSNKAHISYSDITKGDLKYATNTAETWIATTVDNAGDVGYFTSIAIDGNNKTHISYSDETSGHNGYLQYATNSSGTWVTTTVDNQGYTGQDTAIALDSSNKVHISYYDQMSATMNYVTNATGTWVIESAVGYGVDPSIALDSNSKVHISYYGSGCLTYATNTSGNWTTTTVDNALHVGFQSSIALDSNDKVHISYSDLTNGVLKYATNASGSWIITTVDSAGYVGQHSSIALDSNNKPHISYYDASNQDLKYATIASGTWVATTIDRAGNVGQYTSIALDSNNKAHISYWDVTNGDLKYATNAVIDITPPVGTMNINNYAVYANTPTVALTLTCGDLQGSCAQMQFSNNGASWSTPETYAASKASWDITAAANGGTLFDGLKSVYARFQDSAGNWTDPYSAAIVLDATPPAGTMTINSGAALTNIASVALSLVCSDGPGSGCSQMLFSNNGSTWSNGEIYNSAINPNATNWTLSAGDGPKAVYVQYRDDAGNLSSAVTGTIILDTTPPAGSMTINNGALYSISTSVTLTVSASDTYGVTQMQFSNDGTSWSAPVSYASTTTWTLASEGDGVRTVYAKFKDAAGNWSAAISSTIILDATTPSGSVWINANAVSTTSPSVTLTVNCSDATSGCGQMRFSNDNSTWSTPVSFATTTTWSLLASDGTRTAYVQFKDNANSSWSASAWDSIFLDSNAPVTTATPAGGNQANSVGVTLDCTDGTGSGCFRIYYTLSSSATDTPTISSALYTGATITVDGTASSMYLKYFSVDNLGNTEAVRTDTYTFFAATTRLSILLSSQTIKQTDSVDVSGSLSEYSTADIDLSGLPITLVVTLNSVPTATYSTYTDSTNGHYLFNNVTGFGLKGTYGITARFNGTGLLQSANSSTQTLLVGNSAGYALIVEGKVPNDEGLLSHNKTANRIYQQLQDRGFAATNIFYYNYNTGQPGVTNSPSKSAIQSALTGTGLHDLSSKMNAVPAPLWVIMVDHGGPEKFYLGNESITPAELSAWVTDLESKLTAPALLEKRVIVIGACYSGSFIPALATAPTETNGGRIVISSAAAGEESYKGPQEPDGVRSGEFFLEEFFKELAKGAAIRSAFQIATDSTRVFTSQGNGSANGVNYYGDSSVQHPLLDDTGDGNGANTLSDGNGDGITAQTQYLGVGLTNSAANPADLVAVTDPVYLDSSTNQAQLWARPDVYDYVDTAWVEVKAPSTQLAAAGGTGQLELNIPRIFITPNDAAKQWQYEYGTNCADTEGCFDTPGKYEIYYFTRNMYTEEVSLMKRSIVYRDKADNTPPTTPILLSVPSGTTTKTSVFLEWLASTDSDPLTYTVEIALNSSFTGTSVVYRKEELTSTWQFVGQDANLQDKTTYSWRVIAVDKYGGHAASDPWTFTTNNTNYSLGASISITVKDAASGTLLTGATVTFNSVVARVTDATGKCGLPLGSGQNVTVSASKAGYINSTTYTVTVIDGTDAKQEIRLVNQDPSTYRLTIGKSGTGSGSVLGIPSGITCGATCSATYNANQAITLIATPAIGAYFSGWSNGCIGTGSCTVTLTSATTVTALFFAQTYTVTTNAGTGGAISPSAQVSYNTTTSFTVTPTTGYHTTLVTGCSGTLSGNIYTTGPITSPCTIAASFAINTYKVTPKALANGAISPATVQTVTYNTKKAFTITPNTGYHLKLVTGCSGTLSGNIYTTGAVATNCTVTASFAINTYIVTPKAGAHGAISPSTAQTVTYNSSKAFTITPSAGYRIASLTGCPGSLSGSIYTAGPIVSNCSVSVGFALGSVPPLLQGITPTNDSTPTWSWTTGGAGGIGIYRYQLNGESNVWTVSTTTSYTPATALANGTYTLFVQEIDSAGNWSTSGSSAIRVLLTLAKPAKPQGLTANYAAAVTLTWTDSATNEAGYSIYRKKNSEASFTKLSDISPNLEGYVDTTIITNATYSYYVAAYNGAGATNSDAVTITTGDIHAPDQVIAKVLSAGATVNLTWKDMSATEDKNIIKRMQQGASTWSTIATLGPNITTYNNTGRTARIMYTYTVCATGLGGANECSKDVTVNGPSNLKAAKLITGATLTWIDNADDETGYRIYRRKATETAPTQISQGTYTMAYKDSTATNDTTYVYTVEGYTSAGRSSSNEAIVTTGTLTPPTSLTATAIGSQADLTWAHASSTENGYSIWRRKQGDTTWNAVGSTGTGITSYTDSGLTIGSLYSYQVCATTAAGGSACSTPAGINNPTNLQAAYTAGIGMALTWTDNSADETGFKVYRRKSTQANMTAIATTSENSMTYTDATATAAATWFYQVCAANLMNENCGPVVKVVVL